MYQVFQNSMPSGDPCRTMDEVFGYFEELLGQWPNQFMRTLIRNGKSVRIGGDLYNVEKALVTAAAA